MVHRSAEESPFEEVTPFARRFSSSISRRNSSVESNNGYYQEEFIYYRPPDKNYFEGPFTELQCQYWYKEGCFYNGLEFKFGPDGHIETLESLKERNGRECPFQEGHAKPTPVPSVASEFMVKTCMERVISLAGEVDKLKKELDSLQLSRKLEVDSLTNRIKVLMEKDKSNEEYRLKTERKMNDMQTEMAELSLANSAVTTVSVQSVEEEEDVTKDVLETAFCETHSISDKTAADSSLGEDVSEVRQELQRIQSSIQSLDQFTFKLSHKVEKLKCKYKVVDVIGEGLNSKDGVFDRLSYLETAVEEIQEAMEAMKKTTEGVEDGGTKEEKEEKDEEVVIVLPVEREKEEEIHTPRESISSAPEEWHSPNGKFVSSESDPTLTVNSFAAASESIAAVATAAWPGPEKMMEVSEPSDVDNWESIDDEETEVTSWGLEMTNREMATPTPLEDTVEVATGDVDKENLDAKSDGGAGHLSLLGKGLGLLLQSADPACEDNATEADIDRLVTAIKGAKMLQIAESLKIHFGKALVCDVCSTTEKKVELRNAIEYFEHLNRAHFKKCGGSDRVLVNQFAYLLEQFKAAVPVPMALTKRQYAEREKNKPWLKSNTSPTRKTPGKKRK